MTSHIPPLRGPGEEINYVGPWRYWESARGRSLASQNPSDARSFQATNTRQSAPTENVRLASADIPPALRDRSVRATPTELPNSDLTRNDRLDWGSPYRSNAFDSGAPTLAENSFRQSQSFTSPTPHAVTTPPASQFTGSGYRAPRPLPRVTASAPMPSAPVRVRGFSANTELQAVAAADVYEFDGRVRQASVGTSGQR